MRLDDFKAEVSYYDAVFLNAVEAAVWVEEVAQLARRLLDEQEMYAFWEWEFHDRVKGQIQQLRRYGIQGWITQ
jgi:hypothetical protein